MDRVKALRMSEEMIKKDLVSPLTFKDFKKVSDETPSESSNEDMEVYTKSVLICFLFQNLKYYEIEDYIMTFGTKLISLCNSKDGYNGEAKVINGALGDLLVDISRRVEIELMVHLYDALEMFLKMPFSSPLEENMTKNICDVEKIATLDTVFDLQDDYKYEQMTLPGIVITNKKKEKANEILSRTNFYRKDSIRNNIRKYVIKNYTEDMFSSFIDEFNKMLDGLEITKFETIQIKNKYDDLINKLYIYVAPKWLEEEEKKDVNQLTLFGYLR